MLKIRTTHWLAMMCVISLAASASANLIEDGDFEDGKTSPFRKNAPGLLVQAKIYAGDPVKHAKGERDDKDAVSKYCMQFDLLPPVEEDQRPQGNCSFLKHIPVDPTKTYRVSVRAYTPDKLNAALGGYSRDKDKKQLLRPNGSTWGYGIGVRGPSKKGWQTYETTLGPKDSGAKVQFMENIVAVTMTLWVNGNKQTQRGTVYLDDLVFEEVELEKKQEKKETKDDAPSKP